MVGRQSSVGFKPIALSEIVESRAVEQARTISVEPGLVVVWDSAHAEFWETNIYGLKPILQSENKK